MDLERAKVVVKSKPWHHSGVPALPRYPPSRSANPNTSPKWAPESMGHLVGVTLGDVRRLAATLPLSYEALVAGRVKFRVGRIVYLSFSRDEGVMGFAFPKEEREWLIGGSPDKFMLPDRSDLRYHWVLVRLAAIDYTEMRELVLDAWRMVVPKRVAAAYAG